MGCAWVRWGRGRHLHIYLPPYQRILVFGLKRNCDLLEGAAWWAGDGTFKVAPALWTQLYTIHAYAC